MTIGQTVMDTVSGAVTVVSGSASGGRLAGMAGGLTLPAGEASAREWV
jgi:hypothetical protein